MELIPYLLYNVTNTLFVASYAGVDLIDLVNKLLEMGNSRNKARKTRRNMPIEKENEVREKARLAMDRVRHGPAFPLILPSILIQLMTKQPLVQHHK